MKKTNRLVMTALFSAVLCIVSPFVIPLPVSPVPVSLAPCIIFISAFVLPPIQCTVSIFVYLLLGAVGLPVFAGFAGGAGIIAGPTGGYLMGYLAAGFIASLFIGRFTQKYMQTIGMILGLTVMYLIGTIWFCFSQDTGFVAALLICVVPYLFGDAIKITAALFIGTKLSNHKALK